MDWFFHIGTEKTGSSHLQTLLARSRPALVDQGVAFPPGWAHDERSMLSGQISAGNGRLLAKALAAGDDVAVRAELAKAALYTSRAGLKRIVVASEWLLPALAAPNSVSRFLRLLKAQGARTVSILVILRDPLDQVLSLYKHRAKRGTAGDIDSWVSNGYQLPQQLASLRAQADAEQLGLETRAYSRANGALEQLFFGDWLGVPLPQMALAAEINPSLTLTELVLIRQLAKTRPELVVSLFEALAAVAPGDKVKGKVLEAYSRAVAARAVAAHKAEWAAWNARLPSTEQLDVPRCPEDLPPRPVELALSERQMQALADFLARTTTWRFQAGLFWQTRMRPGLGRLARTVGLRQ